MRGFSPRMSFCLLILAFVLILYLIVETTGTNSTLASGAYTADDELAYGVIIDAGSTGSRLFLYHWRVHSDTQLIDIKPALDDHGNQVVRKVTPGLSSFADKPEGAAEYIRPLLDYAVQFVPKENRPYTPVFIFATAGMRLVPEEKRKLILDDLHTKLPKMTEMQIMKEHIRVIEGKWEGIYSWIAVNYILGKFAPTVESADSDAHTPPPSETRRPTVGMVDMGGASVQVAFEMPSNETFRSENTENINLGCHDDDPRFKYFLYVTTFLGFGANEGLRKYEQMLSEELLRENGTYVRDVCMPVNLQKTVKLDDGNSFVRKGIGNWEACTSKLAEIVSNGTSKCSSTCFFGHVSAPSIPLSNMQIYGFSEYWYSLEDVLNLGGSYNHTQIKNKSKAFCNQRWSNIQSQARQNKYPKANDERLRGQCFKSAWITSVLHSGFNVSPTKNQFRSALVIQGQEVQWALGAMIYHMRYFPLRASPTRIQRENVRSSEGHAISLPIVLAVIFVLVLVYVGLKCLLWNKRPMMRRNKSMFSYMMLPNDDRYPSNSPYNFP